MSGAPAWRKGKFREVLMNTDIFGTLRGTRDPAGPRKAPCQAGNMLKKGPGQGWTEQKGDLW